MEHSYVYTPVKLRLRPAPVPVFYALADLHHKTDNLDYNALKREVKVHTRRDQARAVAIPGHHDVALARFEERFYDELCAQHDRVDLFVSSKAAEVASRLGASP